MSGTCARTPCFRARTRAHPCFRTHTRTYPCFSASARTHRVSDRDCTQCCRPCTRRGADCAIRSHAEHTTQTQQISQR
eukprot:1684525-Rhodomonas_salina.1